MLTFIQINTLFNTLLSLVPMFWVLNNGKVNIGINEMSSVYVYNSHIYSQFIHFKSIYFIQK